MLKAQICIFWYFLIVFELWIRFAWDEISLRSYWRLHGNGRFVFHACFQEVWQNWMALEPKRTNFDAKMRDFGVRLTFYSMHQIFLQVLEQDLRAVRSRHAAGRGPRTSKTNRMGCDKKIEQNLIKFCSKSYQTAPRIENSELDTGLSLSRVAEKCRPAPSAAPGWKFVSKSFFPASGLLEHTGYNCQLSVYTSLDFQVNGMVGPGTLMKNT